MSAELALIQQNKNEIAELKAMIEDLILEIGGITIPAGAILPWFLTDADIPMDWEIYSGPAEYSLLMSNSTSIDYLLETDESGRHTHTSYTNNSDGDFNPNLSTVCQHHEAHSGNHAHMIDINSNENLPKGKLIRLIKSTTENTTLSPGIGCFANDILPGNYEFVSMNNDYLFFTSSDSDTTGDDYNETGKTTDTYNFTLTDFSTNVSGSHTHTGNQVTGNTSSGPLGMPASAGGHSHTFSADITIELSSVILSIYKVMGSTKIPKKILILWDDITNIPDGWNACDGSVGTEDYHDLLIKGANFESDTGTINKQSLYPNNASVNITTAIDNNDFIHEHISEDSMDSGSSEYSSILDEMSTPHTHEILSAVGNYIKKTTGLVLLQYIG